MLNYRFFFKNVLMTDISTLFETVDILSGEDNWIIQLVKAVIDQEIRSLYLSIYLVGLIKN